MNNKTERNGKRTFLITLMIGIIVIALVAISWALFSDLKLNQGNIRLGKIQVDLEEDWPEPEEVDEYGVELYSKKVKGVSKGDLPAYVRIRCIPIVEYYLTETEETEGVWITAPIAQKDILLSVNGTDWIYKDGYYYYKNIVRNLGDETSELGIDWEIAEIPSEIKEYKLRTNVKVILEYSQTTNEAWKDIFKIDNLPEELEK